MLYYLIPILIGLLLSFYRFRLLHITSSDPIVRNAFLIITAFIFCGGYMTGSDWRHYELLYEAANFGDLSHYDREKGFYLLIVLFKSLGIQFFPFLVLLKLTVFITLSRFILNIDKDRFYLIFTVFLVFDGLFLFVDNPLRFMIAFGIVVLSFKYLLARKSFKYFSLIFLASLFHISSLILLPVYFFIYIQNINKSASILIYIVAFFVFTPELVSQVLTQYIPQIIFLFEWYFERINGAEFSLFSLGKLMRLFMFITIVIYRESIINSNKFGSKIYSLAIFYFYLSLFSGVIPVFFRLPIYLSIFLCISLSICLINSFNRKYITTTAILIYLIVSPIRLIYSTYVYVPYSNYFTSLIKPDKLYVERSNYNVQKYFERTGKSVEKKRIK